MVVVHPVMLLSLHLLNLSAVCAARVVQEVVLRLLHTDHIRRITAGAVMLAWLLVDLNLLLHCLVIFVRDVQDIAVLLWQMHLLILVLQ